MLAKRLCDILLSGVLLLILSPVLAAVGVAILIRMGRPVLFRQKRAGLYEGSFEVIKFRTMNSKRFSDGTLLPDEERLTPIGIALRKSSVDELPQLWNVLTGQMSLVGPRPLPDTYLERYSEEQRLRHRMKPGITGWAQVNGRNNLSWGQKFELDIWYVSHWSFWLDIKILWLTLLTVLQRRGISQRGHATMPKFNDTTGVSGKLE